MDVVGIAAVSVYVQLVTDVLYVACGNGGVGLKEYVA